MNVFSFLLYLFEPPNQKQLLIFHFCYHPSETTLQIALPLTEKPFRAQSHRKSFLFIKTTNSQRRSALFEVYLNLIRIFVSAITQEKTFRSAKLPKEF
jgi:hypothetical protein